MRGAAVARWHPALLYVWAHGQLRFPFSLKRDAASERPAEAACIACCQKHLPARRWCPDALPVRSCSCKHMLGWQCLQMVWPPAAASVPERLGPLATEPPADFWQVCGTSGEFTKLCCCEPLQTEIGLLGTRTHSVLTATLCSQFLYLLGNLPRRSSFLARVPSLLTWNHEVLSCDSPSLPVEARVPPRLLLSRSWMASKKGVSTLLIKKWSC